ncbi:MAG: class I SAM-dependent methyltransferase [Bacteroidota bacterium]
MLDRAIEYEKMAATEAELWWYRVLHDLVYAQLAGDNRDLAIVDAGCGTGGLLQMLIGKGFANAVGFDLSEHAINFCQDRQLNAFQGDMLEIGTYFLANSKDCIISNDVFYFLSEKEQLAFLRESYRLLKKGGQLIMNVPALAAFGGMHDLSVGIDKRFSKQQLQGLIRQTDFSIKKLNYWPFLLSPIIFAVRFGQRLKMRFFKNETITSDVALPSPTVNRLLYQITTFERQYLPWTPWGSSLLVVLEK